MTATSANHANKIATGESRLRVLIHGAVQGVGFRPFVYRLATEMRLTGWIVNSVTGVSIEVDGPAQHLQAFLNRLQAEKPPNAIIQSIESSFLDPKGFTTFDIRMSDDRGEKTALILPDIATCPDCLREVLDPSDRRYLYPLTNCTNCGPRFTIIEDLPYDRRNTTMKKFKMCEQCRAEYENPLDRRYHAQPNACPECGPRLSFCDAAGENLCDGHEALLKATEAIRSGAIVAVKGLGGFHLMVDAANNAAVAQLRQRKNREEKPFALMFPTLDAVRTLCRVSELEAQMLTSPAAPIVLLLKSENEERRAESGERKRRLSQFVAPGNPYLGVLLPYTPLHHILLRELGLPVVATSGNLSDEPICIDEQEALAKLGRIADFFLAHDRPIARHADDSIVRIMAGRELVMRRARGFAPLPVPMKDEMPAILAVGAHLKNTVAMSVGKNIFVSQHIGDLDTAESYNAFIRVIDDFRKLYDRQPELLACDAHPDYLSTQYTGGRKVDIVQVQHHYAHVLACMAENEIDAPVLGVSWDGTGYGLDGTVWGGEFFLISEKSFWRVAHLRTFRLPGGDKAVKEPRRSALGLLFELHGEDLEALRDIPTMMAFSPPELTLIRTMLRRKVNSPETSSAGRLFDAVASLLGLKQKVRFEGQAAMALEFACVGAETDAAYSFDMVEKRSVESVERNEQSRLEARDSELATIIDWQPMIRQILQDVQAGIPTHRIATKFHNTLAEAIVAVAKNVEQKRVVLSGGCFQNKYLTERTIKRLREEGFLPYWHQRIPPNDGGISLGQIVAAARELKS